MGKIDTDRVLLEDSYQKVVKDATSLARGDLVTFAALMNLEYDIQWFHRRIYEYLQRWVEKKIRKLAIFMPPQHGKSTMSSIITPAYILGMNPRAKVVCASYNQIVSSKFNRLTQDIMNQPLYRYAFPKTVLPASGIIRNNELKNATYFETVGNKGFYRSVGVGGSLTGTTIEYGVIDDPIKDRLEANSKTYRERLWEWYIDVWSTRMNNESCELMLFTRWHEDDLAGRLFDKTNPCYDEKRANKWTVIVLPALKEDAPSPIAQSIEIGDRRKEGEALWPSFHSRESHEEDKRNNPYTFASLKQQRPSPLEGGLFKRNWFNVIKESELPFNPKDEFEPVPVHFMIDGAFTDKTTNDPTAQIAYYVWEGSLYIKNCVPVNMALNEYLKFIREWLEQNDYGLGSHVRVEYKSSGPALLSLLKKEEYGGFNVSRINDRHVSWGKMTRGEYATPGIAAGKVYVIQGSWNEAFIKQCITFPNDVHDDMYDCLCYAVLQEIQKAGKRVIKSNVSLGGKII